MLTFLLSLRAHERSTVWAFAAAGAAAGFAGSMKYNGALAVVMPLLACAMSPGTRPSRFVAMVGIVAAMVIALFVGTPYSLFDLPRFLNEFARLASQYRAPSTAAEPIWIIYLKHLRNALQWPGSLLVLVGLAVSAREIVRGPERLKWLLLIVFPLVYFWFVSHQNIIYARYLLPLIPFLSLLAATAVVWSVERLRPLHVARPAVYAVTGALTLAAVVSPAYTAIRFDADEAKEWTTEQAYSWMWRELPPGSRITAETRGVLPPPTQTMTHVAQLRLRPPEDYTRQGADYLLASSQNYALYYDVERGGPQTFPTEYAEYQRIFGSFQEVARFSPSRDHPGPELRILRVKP
jgi:hypothetical protein